MSQLLLGLARAGYRVMAYSRRGYLTSSSFDEEHAPVGADHLDALVNHLGVEKFYLVSLLAAANTQLTMYFSIRSAPMSFVVISSFMAFRDREHLAITGQLLPPEFNALPTNFKALSPSYRTINPEGMTS